MRQAKRKMRNAAIASLIFAIAHLAYAQFMKYSESCQANMRSQEFCEIAIQVLVILAVFLLVTGLGVILRSEIAARLLPLYPALVLFFLVPASIVALLGNWTLDANQSGLIIVVLAYGLHLYFAYQGLEGMFAYQDLIKENKCNQQSLDQGAI
ncbi:hypothetical protein [Thalassoporum mexicanum]|uniref:hypothetical protein n=1 Tax=Thalassoporum mexicanum TaxID=3457544 RepID=UPI0012E9E7FA|nr:hypothetical protein [Pseudanabaena sp. PCC 7367]